LRAEAMVDTDHSTLKRVLTVDEIASLLEPIGNVAKVTQFDGGMFASVACAEMTDGRRLAVKSAPPSTTTALLAHESRVMLAELEVLRLGLQHTGLRLPALVMSDLTRTVVDVDVIVTEVIDGSRWDTCASSMTPSALRAADYEHGRTLAAYARISGDRFGFVSDRAPEYSAGDWYTTVRQMFQGVIDDGERYGVELPGTEALRAVERQRANLASVRQPRLVHGDLWIGNVFVRPDSGSLVGVIDPERALWGDPLFDVAAATQGSLSGPSESLVSGLRDGGGDFDSSVSGRARLDLYLLWFAITMIAETGSRRDVIDDPGSRVKWLLPQVETLLGRIP
jgi:aminoglycoside phosphotransferase (APT) family kinase protein